MLSVEEMIPLTEGWDWSDRDTNSVFRDWLIDRGEDKWGDLVMWTRNYKDRHPLYKDDWWVTFPQFLKCVAMTSEELWNSWRVHEQNDG